MAKDYAKYILAHHKRKAKQKRDWRRLAFIAACLVLVAGGSIYGLQHASFSWSKKLVLLTHATSQPKSPNKPTLPHSPAEGASEEIQFYFYTELPRRQIDSTTPMAPVIAEQAKPAHAVLSNQIDETLKTAVSEKKIPDNYIVQVALVDTLSAASQLRLSLLLSGVETSVVKAGNQFRVQQGPFVGIEAAKKSQRRLEGKGIECSVSPLSSPSPLPQVGEGNK